MMQELCEQAKEIIGKKFYLKVRETYLLKQFEFMNRTGLISPEVANLFGCSQTEFERLNREAQILRIHHLDKRGSLLADFYNAIRDQLSADQVLLWDEELGEFPRYLVLERVMQK